MNIYPEENFSLKEAKGDDFYKIMLVNTSLKKYQFKNDFPWLIWINIHIKNVTKKFNLPTDQEALLLNEIEDSILKSLKIYANIHFVGRITDDGNRELYFHSDKPEGINEFLQATIISGDYEREFEYEIRRDPEWEIVDFFW